MSDPTLRIGEPCELCSKPSHGGECSKKILGQEFATLFKQHKGNNLILSDKTVEVDTRELIKSEIKNNLRISIESTTLGFFKRMDIIYAGEIISSEYFEFQ